MRHLNLRTVSTVAAMVLFLVPVTGLAAVCNVPSGSHPTIQAAVDDASCTEVMIAAGSFAESVAIERSLVVLGNSSTTTTIEGRFLVTGSTTEVAISDLRIDTAAPSAAGCFSLALDVSDGAEVTGNNIVVVNADGDACPLFSDGFESGDTSAWSSTAP